MSDDYDGGYTAGFAAGHAAGYTEGKAIAYSDAKLRFRLALDAAIESLSMSHSVRDVLRSAYDNVVGKIQ